MDFRHLIPEVWRPVVGYENFYEVSNFGRVRRALTARPGGNSHPGRIIELSKDGNGYLCVTLSRRGKQKTHAVHRLVLIAFVGYPPYLHMEAAHGDGDQSNCRLDNLRWATKIENGADMIAHGRATGPGRLDEPAVSDIRRRFGTETRTALAAEFGVTPQTIYKVATGRSHRASREKTGAAQETTA